MIHILKWLSLAHLFFGIAIVYLEILLVYSQIGNKKIEGTPIFF